VARFAEVAVGTPAEPGPAADEVRLTVHTAVHHWQQLSKNQRVAANGGGALLDFGVVDCASGTCLQNDFAIYFPLMVFIHFALRTNAPRES
jgi:hypothetical protein